MSWLDNVYLYLGTSAPKGVDVKGIKQALLTPGNVRVVCCTDDELCKAKYALKKTPKIQKEKNIVRYNADFSSEMYTFFNTQNTNLSFAKPSEIKKFSKTFKKTMELDKEKSDKAIKVMEIMKKNAETRAEESRKKKEEEMKKKQLEKFQQEAEERLRAELLQKDLDLEEFEEV